MSQTPSQIEERRMELVSKAARSARANEPRQFVLLAGLVLAGTLLALLLSWRSYASADRKLEAEQATSRKVVDSVAKLKGLQADEASNPSGPKLESTAQVASRIEGAGGRAGLRDGVRTPITKSDKQPNSNVVRVTRTYEVRDPKLGPILLWINTATQEVPGLEVYSIILKPEAQVWYVKVAFLRWERAEGS